MIKKVLTSLILLFGVAAQAQIEDFENLNMGPDSVFNGENSQKNMIITSQFVFPVIWDTTFNYWLGGFAASTTNDSSTRGPAGIYDVVNGTVPSGTHYLVGQQASNMTVVHQPQKRTRPVSMKLALNTYAYYSMKDGDQFAKKFGGDDGNDPDYLILKVFAYDAGTQMTDSTEIALADFRFDDNAEDYIQFDWTTLDLTVFDDMEVQSLTFVFSSSDEGDFGINTPTFFVMDDLQYESNPVGMKGVEQVNYKVYPNPSADFVYGQDFTSGWQLLDVSGKLILQGTEARIDMRGVKKGVYLVRLKDGRQARIVKQ